MRSAIYALAVIGLLSGLILFATTPAVALTLDPSMQKAATTIEHKGPTANPSEMGSSGQSKSETNHQSQAKSTRGTHSANLSAQAKGEEATVARVDRIGRCLHVYRHPSIFSKKIGCMSKGEKTHLSGIFSKNRRWAQLDNQGWVLFKKLKPEVKAHRTAAKGMPWSRAAATGIGASRIAQHNDGRSGNCCLSSSSPYNSENYAWNSGLLSWGPLF